MSHWHPRLTLVRFMVAGLLLAGAANPSFAVLPDEVLSDSRLEARARAISKDLRCLVCQNQSIDDSNAPLAKDLRVILRERLVAGDSDDQAVDYIVARYGNYVLLKPPFQTDTVLLWLAPFLVLLVTLGVTAAYLRKRPLAETESSAPLSKEDLDSLASQLKES
jgi:cytochrome c-type biogenesis protein CcmH